MPVKITDVHFEHHRSGHPPLEIGEPRPRISWSYSCDPDADDDKKWVQESYQLHITQDSREKANFRVQSRENLLVPWPGPDLVLGEEATVRIRAFAEGGKGRWNGRNLSRWRLGC